MPAKILPVANQAPHKTEGLPRRLPLNLNELTRKLTDTDTFHDLEFVTESNVEDETRLR